MNDHALVVEKYGGNQRLACLSLLLGDHGVEAADGVRLQPRDTVKSYAQIFLQAPAE